MGGTSVRQRIDAALTCLLLAAMVAACTSSSRPIYGQVPRNAEGEPIWAEIKPSPPRPGHGPIFVPAGPPIRTAQGMIIQPNGN